MGRYSNVLVTLSVIRSPALVLLDFVQDQFRGIAVVTAAEIDLVLDQLAGSMEQLRGHSITYRIAVGPHAGRKVFTLQTLPACDPEDTFGEAPGNVVGFSLHAAVATKAHERDKLELLTCTVFMSNATWLYLAKIRSVTLISRSCSPLPAL